jgi:shikimate kinase
MKKITLIGFMGCGKSTTSKLLAKHYNIPLISVDDEIEKNTNKKIKNIFSEFGESYFRNLEHLTIADTVKNNDSYVIDLGGGAFVQENNRDILEKNKVESVFLDVSFNVLCKRLENERDNRPMLKENWKYEAKKLFEYRYPFYKKAKFVISIEDESADYVLEMIIKKIENNI